MLGEVKWLWMLIVVVWLLVRAVFGFAGHRHRWTVMLPLHLVG